MSRGASPLRFLGLVLGGWMCGRILFLAPNWVTEAAVAEPGSPAVLAEAAPNLPSPALAPASVTEPPAPAPVAASKPTTFAVEQSWRQPLVGGRPVRLAEQAALPFTSTSPAQLLEPVAPLGPAQASRLFPAAVPQTPLAATPALNRWSLSTWAHVRRGSGGQLATGGTLGGSQVGARATYALSQRLAISARLYSPLSRASGAEAALGVEVQPLAAVPVRVLTERRQAIGRDGRSALALLAHGGVSERPLPGGLRLDAYAQAGVVGLRSRDGFVDGALRVGLPLGDKINLGIGAWGAAQPGASRVDVGPHASYRLPLLGGSARISADWRVRVGGDARPGSGPALTLSTDF